jgi:putative flippase GtrA
MNGIVEFIIYVIIGILGLGLDTLFIWLFTDKLKLYYMISKIISTGLVFIWNFLARKGMYVIANKLRKEK